MFSSLMNGFGSGSVSKLGDLGSASFGNGRDPVAASVVVGIVNLISGIITNAFNSGSNSSTNAANMAMNQANIDFQREENAITREREDNAVQRRANDLVKAGLSKTLAAGSPAAASSMTAPSNTFAKQAFRADAPKFEFGYDPVEATYAPTYAQAAADNAEAAKSNAETEKWKSRMEFFKFLKQYGFDVKKFMAEHGLDVEKFEHEKSMDNKEFALKSWLGSEGIKIDKAKLYLSKEELDIARTELEDKLKNTMSERAYREWSQMYEAANLELAKHKDKREAAMLSYNILEIQARVKNYLADVKLSDAQVRYYNKMGKKIISEMVVNAAQALKLDAETQNVLEKTLTEIYNRGIATEDGGKTTDHTVTSSEAHENALDRANEHNIANTASMSRLLGIVLYCLLPGGFKGFYSNMGIN